VNQVFVAETRLEQSGEAPLGENEGGRADEQRTASIVAGFSPWAVDILAARVIVSAYEPRGGRIFAEKELNMKLKTR
jgi:hypothetical protein